MSEKHNITWAKTASKIDLLHWVADECDSKNKTHQKMLLIIESRIDNFWLK